VLVIHSAQGSQRVVCLGVLSVAQLYLGGLQKFEGLTCAGVGWAIHYLQLVHSLTKISDRVFEVLCSAAQSMQFPLSQQMYRIHRMESWQILLQWFC
jgi:hypothetical protein